MIEHQSAAIESRVVVDEHTGGDVDVAIAEVHTATES